MPVAYLAVTPASKDWIEISSKAFKNHEHRLLKNGIRCTFEANKGNNVF